MKNVKNKFIGSGVVFPIIINDKGRPDVVNDISLINSSIKIILSWPQNHKYFNERFGSRLEDVLEEPSDAVTHSLLRHFVREALELWEKRIKVNSVSIQSYTGEVVNISINYNIRNTKIEETLIYPFYKEIIY